jgi:drug/metabolite transporter (DMT)-like permease
MSHGRTTRLALLNAVVITAYTLNDGLGARRSGSAFAYTLATFLFTALPYLPLHTGMRWSRWRLHFHPSRLGLGLLAGGMSVASYGLALWAMSRAPIAPVAALRESAILFGLVFARLFLAEPIGWQRGLCGMLIFGGVCLLRLV